MTETTDLLSLLDPLCKKIIEHKLNAKDSIIFAALKSFESEPCEHDWYINPERLDGVGEGVRGDLWKYILHNEAFKRGLLEEGEKPYRAHLVAETQKLMFLPDDVD